MSEVLHGFYSRKGSEAAAAFNAFERQIPRYCEYEKADGTLVQVTCVFKSKEQGDSEYLWPDKQYVGEVVKWIRSVR